MKTNSSKKKTGKRKSAAAVRTEKPKTNVAKPRKSKKPTKREDSRSEHNAESVTLDYSLADLPSSQHRAGLAGLVLMLRWLDNKKRKAGSIARIVRIDENGASIEINGAGLGEIFDELYAADEGERGESKIRKHKKTKQEIKPLRTETKEVSDRKGKKKTVTYYYYPEIVPKGSFLLEWDPSRDGSKGIWIKLWRDFIWTTLRAVPATRIPYENRAQGEPTKDVQEVWRSIVDAKDDASVELPSTYFLGAQARSAENISFEDRPKRLFLLHFWPLVAQLYVPQVLDNEGERNFQGFSIVVPDIRNLDQFCEQLPVLLQNERSKEIDGYRPRDAVVSIPAEGALEFMVNLKKCLVTKTGQQSVIDFVLGFDVLHVEREGNNVRMRSVTRIPAQDVLIDEFNRLRGLWNPRFKAQRIANLLSRAPAWHGFDRIFHAVPIEQTLENRAFQHDAKMTFEPFIGGEMKDDDENSNQLERLVFQVVRSYVYTKLESKYQLRWEDSWKGTPKESAYREKKEKIAREAFLGVRSRQERADFVDYFAGTLCSVPQRVGSSEGSFVQISRALMGDHWNDVRTLTLLALSANA